MGTDFYQVLGVSRNAGSEEIKRAYKTLALKYHPDKNKSSNAEANFKKIGEAYEILGHRKTRDMYDKIQHLKYRNGVLESRVNSLTTEVQFLRQSRDLLERKRNNNDLAMLEKTRKIETLTNQLQRLREHQRLDKSVIATLTNQANNLRETNDHLRTEQVSLILTHHKEMKESQAEVKRLRDEVKMLQIENKKLKNTKSGKSAPAPSIPNSTKVKSSTAKGFSEDASDKFSFPKTATTPLTPSPLNQSKRKRRRANDHSKECRSRSRRGTRKKHVKFL